MFRIILIAFCCIILFLVLLKMVKSVVKAFLIISFIIIAGLALLSVVLVKNAGEFQEKLPFSKKLILVEKDGALVSGTTLTSFEFFEGSPPQGLTPGELNLLNTAYDPGNLSSVQGDSFIVLVFSEDFFLEGLPDSLVLGKEGNDTENISKGDMLAIMFGDEPSLALARWKMGSEETSEDEGLIKAMRETLLDGREEEDLRSMFVLMGLSSIMDSKGMSFLALGIKDGGVLIHPTFVIFWAVDYIPDFLIKWVLGT